ncbi:hypothetical protein CR513_53323, partial [Mucuna pruriens]
RHPPLDNPPLSSPPFDNPLQPLFDCSLMVSKGSFINYDASTAYNDFNQFKTKKPTLHLLLVSPPLLDLEYLTLMVVSSKSSRHWAKTSSSQPYLKFCTSRSQLISVPNKRLVQDMSLEDYTNFHYQLLLLPINTLVTLVWTNCVFWFLVSLNFIFLNKNIHIMFIVIEPASSPFSSFHHVIWGPHHICSTLGYSYFVTFIDDFPHCTWGIIHQTTYAHTPQQNVVAKRKNCHLVEIARTILIHYNVLLCLWGDALLAACFLINRMPLSVLDNQVPQQDLYPHSSRVSGYTYFVHDLTLNLSNVLFWVIPASKKWLRVKLRFLVLIMAIHFPLWPKLLMLIYFLRWLPSNTSLFTN